MMILYNVENLRALRFKSSYVFLKRPQGPVLLWYDAGTRRLASGSAAFIESCAAIGWMDCDTVS